MKRFKFFQKENHFEFPIARRMAGRTIANYLVPVQPLGTPDNDVRILRNSLYGAMRIREVAVVCASFQDFNRWRTNNFNISEIRQIYAGTFFRINRLTSVITRYRAILDVSDCRGLFFDEYISSDRTINVLMGHDTNLIEHINNIINEVRLHTRQENNI